MVLKKLHLYSSGTDQTFPLGVWFDNFWTVTITDDIEKHRTFVDIFCRKLFRLQNFLWKTLSIIQVSIINVCDNKVFYKNFVR